MIAFKKHLFVQVFVLLFFITVSLSTFAVGLSAYRIKLDNNNMESEFIVFNKSVVEQQCTIDLTDIIFDQRGERIPFEGVGNPEISAKKLIKYSPRRFDLKGNGNQIIRFKYRRKRSADAVEYRSYLSLMCNNSANNLGPDKQVSVMPKLRINIPIIVRTGEIPVNLQFSSISSNNETLTVTVTKTGKRSVYGSLELVDRETGKVIRQQKGFSLHAEVTTSLHQFNVQDIDVESLRLQFVEDEKLSGNLIISQNIN